MTDVQKNESTVRLSLEHATMFAGPEWQRKVEHVQELPVPEQDWDDYYDALRLRDRLLDFRCVHGADIDIEEPTPRRVYTYAETEEEWRERIWAKIDAGEQPTNQLLIPDPGIVDLYYGSWPTPQQVVRDIHAIGRAQDYRTFKKEQE